MTERPIRKSGQELSIINIRGIRYLNFQEIRDTLRSTVIDTDTKLPVADEIEEILERINQTNKGDASHVYCMAVVGNAIRGVMGMRKVGDRNDPMRKFAGEQPAAEIINASVDPQAPRIGIGSRIHEALLDLAIMDGAEVSVVNSGPRYRYTGWPFWNKLYGAPIGTAKDLYGPGLDAPVWVKKLSDDRQM